MRVPGAVLALFAGLQSEWLALGEDGKFGRKSSGNGLADECCSSLQQAQMAEVNEAVG